jgi:hypothetical protein
VIELDTLPVFGGEPRAARWRKAVRLWLHERGLCDLPYVVALAWRAEEGGFGNVVVKPSQGLSNAGVVYASSPRDAALKRWEQVGGPDSRSPRIWFPYVLFAVTTGHSDDTGTFFDGEMREVTMEEAVAVLRDLRRSA